MLSLVQLERLMLLPSSLVLIGRRSSDSALGAPLGAAGAAASDWGGASAADALLGATRRSRLLLSTEAPGAGDITGADVLLA